MKKLLSSLLSLALALPLAALPSSALELFLDQRFPDERIERIYPNMKLT